MRGSKAQRGLTLIEVLIAAIILFAVVASVSQVYQVAVTASIRASRTVESAALVPLLADTITFQVRQAETLSALSGKGIIDNFVFSWSASVINRSPPAPRFEFQTDNYVVGEERFYLWKVELQVSRDSFQRDYQFTVLSWKGL